MLATLIAREWMQRLADRLQPRRKALAALRSQWGKPGCKGPERHADLPGIGESGALCTLTPIPALDERTWNDLEFPAIFNQLDTTVSPVGSQWLHAALRRGAVDPAALHAASRQLGADAGLRERIQLALAPLAAPVHGAIAGALLDAPQTPPPRWPLLAWSVASLALLVAVVVWSWSAWWWLAVLPINLVVLYRLSWRTLREIEAVSACLRLAAVADALAALPATGAVGDLLDRLRAAHAPRVALRRALRVSGMLRREPWAWFAVWLNLALLLELVVHAWSITRFHRLRAGLAPTFELVGELDAAIALASSLAMYPHHCVPIVVDDQRLEIADGLHPLLPRGTANSVSLVERSALVTGSNMAGKTTFVKMLAINAILGRHLGFCLATRAVLPAWPVLAAIHGVHSVASGKSHFFAEVEAVRSMLATAAQQACLYVLDEPFSGTNTVERIAITRAVLATLGARGLALVTTHDVELQSLLGNRYALFHFQENPDVDGYFDHRLHTGAATERNAIRLLERMAFPPEVVASAADFAGSSAND